MKTVEHKNGLVIKKLLSDYLNGLCDAVVLIEKLLSDYDNLEVEEFDDRMEEIYIKYLDPAYVVDGEGEDDSETYI